LPTFFFFFFLPCSRAHQTAYSTAGRTDGIQSSDS
jgi:hypothetical protein